MTEERDGPCQDDTPVDGRGPALARSYAVYYRRLKKLLIISGILAVAGFALSLLRTQLVKNTPQAILQVRPPDNPPIVTAQIWFDRPNYDRTRYGLRTGMRMVDGMRHESTEIVPCAENGAMGENAVATILATPVRKTGRQSGNAVELSISSSIVMKLELDPASPPCVVRHVQDDRPLTLPIVLVAGEHRLRLEWPSVATAPSRPAISTSQESQR